MSVFRKISVGSAVTVGIYIACLLLLPHRDSRISTVINHATLCTLFFVTLFLFLKEPSKSNRFIFFNFFLTFLVAVINISSEFVGIAFLNENPYTNFVYWQYSTIAFFFFLGFSITYIVIDSLFHERKTFQKYLFASLILFSFVGYYFAPMFKDPMSAYKTEEIKQWKALDHFIESSGEAREMQAMGDRQALAVLLSNQVRLQSWKEGIPIGDLYPDQNFARIETLIPYLEGDNYQILIVRPVFLGLVQINVLLVTLIIVFFGYQYAKDPPQGAYIDKIMFALLLFCSMEILHNLAFVKSLEWTTWSELSNVGQIVTICIETLLVLFFSLRLRFVTSVQGEFYETELELHPQRITRWRDWIDNMILSHFFNPKPFHGRFFEDRSAK